MNIIWKLSGRRSQPERLGGFSPPYKGSHWTPRVNLCLHRLFPQRNRLRQGCDALSPILNLNGRFPSPDNDDAGFATIVMDLRLEFLIPSNGDTYEIQ